MGAVCVLRDIGKVSKNLENFCEAFIYWSFGRCKMALSPYWCGFPASGTPETLSGLAFAGSGAPETQ